MVKSITLEFWLLIHMDEKERRVGSWAWNQIHTVIPVLSSLMISSIIIDLAIGSG